MIVSDWRHRTSYKLMIQLGFTQIFGLITTCPYMSISLLQGRMFCSNPEFEYVTCCILFAQWVVASSNCDILGFNRLCELYSENLARKLFGGWRLYIWMAFPPCYGIFTSWHITPILWNSKYAAFFSNPHYGYFYVSQSLLKSDLH
jgi:putative chemoreceptor